MSVPPVYPDDMPVAMTTGPNLILEDMPNVEWTDVTKFQQENVNM